MNNYYYGYKSHRKHNRHTLPVLFSLDNIAVVKFYKLQMLTKAVYTMAAAVYQTIKKEKLGREVYYILSDRFRPEHLRGAAYNIISTQFTYNIYLVARTFKLFMLKSL